MLTYAQQSKEQAKIEQDKLAKRIQEFRTQSELDQLQASNNLATSSNAVRVNGYCMDAYKSKDAIILATSKGEVSWLLTVCYQKLSAFLVMNKCMSDQRPSLPFTAKINVVCLQTMLWRGQAWLAFTTQTTFC